MTTKNTRGLPTSGQRAALNAALFTDNIETGFWDDQGRPAPWPDDIDEWTPATSDLADQAIGSVEHLPRR
ncbi:hypothetical protein AAH979_38010 [Plantactinospora sp. ZYX-F-223]|uniref:hypothetical protein n=1 Tax=Plantactinospora sp. ZYX-F-223 TaxID=3144103 RepID=UPI0031FC2172